MQRRTSGTRTALAVLLAAIATSLTSVPASAQLSAPRDAQVVLSQHKVLRAADGTESLAAVERAAPGEVIEYRAAYHNRSAVGHRNVELTIPVPPGMQWVEHGARPHEALATVDHKRFQPIPLKRMVRTADGRETEVLVPAAEYKAIRWRVGEVGAGRSAEVAARMRLTPSEGQIAAARQ